MALLRSSPDVKEKSAYIQAAFLLGWALGGAFSSGDWVTCWAAAAPSA
ncbi:MAG: hypothetical protein QM758_16905 [Armatimonas sp.]